ncbi:MAG: hydantoinase/oxoprolinase family protein [Acidimicrobiales bacterium]
MPVSISAEVSPQMREYERFNTVCANAYVRPVIARYLTNLAAALDERGATTPLRLMHSGGGLIDLATAEEFPVRLLESGPAGGAVYAADLAARLGRDKVVAFDMGGTTAKITIIEGGQPRSSRTFEVARTSRFKKGSGTPISIPVVEMIEIGAGGGSIATIDRLGRIAVGPRSAGSEPVPAAYGLGGTEATVSDADLLLGRLDPDAFGGDTIRLSPRRAAAAVDQAIGAPMHLDTDAAARGSPRWSTSTWPTPSGPTRWRAATICTGSR